MTRPGVGTIALVGSGEFLAPIAPVDQALCRLLAEEARVAIVPTAAAPDGDSVFQRWLDMGVEHFARIGAQAEPVALRTRSDAEKSDVAASIARANFVYLSGGKPGYLRATLAETVAWRAIVGVYESGGVVAGCSAGAMVLGDRMLGLEHWAIRSVPALALAKGVTIIPHFDDMPAAVANAFGRVTQAIAGYSTTVVGVDGSTALVCRDDEWTVIGSGRVTAFGRRARKRYASGQTVPVAGPSGDEVPAG
jgi:cyanophycinase